MAFRGNENRILLASFRASHEFVLSQDVREEARRVLMQKFARLRGDVEEVLSLVLAEIVPREAYERVIESIPPLRDPKDAHVLAAAIASDCDILVTRDKDLLRVREFGKLRIIRPVAALQILGI